MRSRYRRELASRIGFMDVGAGRGFALALAVFLALSCGREDGSRDSGGENPLGDIVVAHAGGRDITIDDLDTKLRVQFGAVLETEGIGGIKQRSEVLKAMADQLTWVHEGEKQGFDEHEEFRETLELSRQFILSNYTVNKLVYEQAVPTEEELRQYYEENLDQYRIVARVRASHILLPTRAEAERVRNLALKGEDFAGLARRHSLDDQTRDQGGNIGLITDRSTIRGFEKDLALNEAIMALQPGKITQPLQSPRGWSLFLIDERTDESQRPFEEVRDQIEEAVSKKKAHLLFSSTLDRLREETGAGIDEEGWLLFTARFLSEDELFQMARSEKRPDERIRIYEMVLQEHSEGAKAAQALFMIGFTQAEDLREYEQARETFQQVLDRYPEHELAASARWMIENMDQGMENLPYVGQIKNRALSG